MLGNGLERGYIGGGVVVRCLEDQVLKTRDVVTVGLPVCSIPVNDLEKVFVEGVGGHVVVD
jgi:hypothetical protein